MFEMPQEIQIYQDIGTILSQKPPEKWSSIVLESSVDEDLTTSSFVYHNSDFVEKELFSMDFDHIGRDDRKIIRSKVEELWQIYKRKNNKPWNYFTFTLKSDGKFETEFDYDTPLPWEDN